MGRPRRAALVTATAFGFSIKLNLTNDILIVAFSKVGLQSPASETLRHYLTS
jgi:hypothetical protein